jgi:hypothetical protein
VDKLLVEVVKFLTISREAENIGLANLLLLERMVERDVIL